MRNAISTTQSSGLRTSRVLNGGRKNQSKRKNAANAITTPSTRPPDALAPRTTSRKTRATWDSPRLDLNEKRMAAARSTLAHETVQTAPRARIQPQAPGVALIVEPASGFARCE